MEYNRQVGCGPRRNDIFHSQLAALLHNCHRSDKTLPAKPKDYNPYHEEPEVSPEELVQSWKFAMATIKATTRG